MKSVQEIFNTVINHGYYKSRFDIFDIHRTSPYLCLALSIARLDGVITAFEEHRASLAIFKYLEFTGWSSLEGALQQYHLPNDFEQRLHLYRNWADRPALTYKE